MLKKVMFAAFNLMFLTGSLITGVYFVRESQEVGISASAITAMSLETDQPTYHVGDRFSVAVTVDAAKEAVGFVDAKVHYDPKMLSGVSVAHGSYFEKTQVIADEIDNRNGMIRYQAQVAPGVPPSVGRGTVAILIFDVVGTGQAQLDVASESIAASSTEASNVLQSTSELMITTK